MNKQDIELKLYNVIRRNLSIQDFEHWLYDADEVQIDEYFGKGFYFELASLNYRDKFIINTLENLLYTKIPFGRFEEIKIRDILNSVIEDKKELAELLEELYDLYCDGYLFLRYIGMAYVFHGMPRENDTYTFDEKTQENLKNEANRILSFLNTEKIVITGEYEYEDNRMETEKVELHSLEMMYKEPKKGLLHRIINKFKHTK